MSAGFDTRAHQPRELASVAGMVFQEPEAQTVARTVQEEIIFGLENRGADPVLIRKRLEEVLDALGIAPLRLREMKTLSGGELQRVAIAAVLTMQPRLILMDEPTSQLDPQAADDVLRLTRDLRDDYGLAVVVAEHRLERVAAYVDRVLHVTGEGTLDDLAPRDAMSRLPGSPPVSRIATALNWSPMPLSIAEARRFMPATDRAAESVSESGSTVGSIMTAMRGVEVQLGGRSVLSIDELVLRAGECVGLMGRNGAGKTTLLRTMAALVNPTRGTIEGPTNLEPTRRYRDIAFVPQDPAATLYKPTIEAEISDVLQGTGREGNVEAALAEWNLECFGHHDARDLSVGERQRVSTRGAHCWKSTLDPARRAHTGDGRGHEAATRPKSLASTRRGRVRGTGEPRRRARSELCRACCASRRGRGDRGRPRARRAYRFPHLLNASQQALRGRCPHG